MDLSEDTMTSDVASSGLGAQRRIKLRPFPPSLVMVGASTGGPQALVEFLAELGPALPFIAVCVTLHMPPDLMPVIAAHVTRKCQVASRVVIERVRLEPGFVHFAPGGRHVEFLRSPGAAFDVAPQPEQRRDFCEPAVDAMFSSGAKTHGARAIAVVLSGMGSDGLRGAHELVAAGGLVLVQSKETSAVWGMPGAVAKASLAAAALSPAELARDVNRRVLGRRTA